jgi:hypothetical protein
MKTRTYSVRVTLTAEAISMGAIAIMLEEAIAAHAQLQQVKHQNSKGHNDMEFLSLTSIDKIEPKKGE